MVGKTSKSLEVNDWIGLNNMVISKMAFLYMTRIARVISQINPKQFQKSFICWIASCHVATAGDVIAIDGKTVRRSFDKNRKQGAIHMVSAFSTANKVVLAQLKTATKSNEITTIPELLNLLEIKGCIVTIDAMGCDKEIAKTILEREADYLLAVKGN